MDTSEHPETVRNVSIRLVVPREKRDELQRLAERCITEEFDERSVQMLLDKIEPLIRIAIARVKSRHIASLLPGYEDMLQEARLLVVQLLHTWKPGRGSFVSYLDRYFIPRFLRAVYKGAAVHYHEVTPDVPVEDLSAMLTGSCREQTLWLDDAIMSLTARQQEAVRLRYLEGMTLAQVASEMGITHQAVSRLLHRANRRLRR